MGWVGGFTVTGKSEDGKIVFESKTNEKYGDNFLILVQPKNHEESMSLIRSIEIKYWNEHGFEDKELEINFHVYEKSEKKIVESEKYTLNRITMEKQLGKKVTSLFGIPHFYDSEDTDGYEIANLSIPAYNLSSNSLVICTITYDDIEDDWVDEIEFAKNIFQKYDTLDELSDEYNKIGKFIVVNIKI